MIDDGSEPKRRRGTVLLIATIIIIASIAGLNAIPPTYTIPDLAVRVAIIDSGININQELEPRVVAERSFVNSTYGYSEDDNLTIDSNPEDIPHGTLIAMIIASEAPDAALVNAKVVSSNDIATPIAIVEAIRWAVLEENCSVINLSLGFSPIDNDLVGEAVRWAFNQGVSIIAAAGNNGQNGISGSSVESPAMYPEVIAVAAVDESNELYSFSARGPLRDRIMKPDIAALGSYTENGRTVLGTSFAAPVVTAGVARMISHCLTNGLSWTPGMIKAAVMIGASNLPYGEWQVGAGLFDLEGSLLYIDYTNRRGGLPLIAVVTPTVTPFTFERYFINKTSRIHISIFASGNDTFTFNYGGVGGRWLQGPTSLYVNQSGSFEVDLLVESSGAIENQDAYILVSASGYFQIRIDLKISAIVPLHNVAFDISHTSWSIDSTYGQFRELYRTLINAGVSVDELRYSDNLTSAILSSYDAIFVLDPCAWGTSVEGFSYSKIGIFTYTSEELAAYSEFYENGGSLFLVGLSNTSIDHIHANDLFSIFNITLINDQIPGITITINGISSTKLITDMIPHNITNLVDSFDYNGCSLNFTGDGYEIAWTEYRWVDTNGTIHVENRTVVVGLENANGGRLIATGSNFFLDNWALANMYRSDHDWRFVVQTVYWLLHIY